jgi:cardiolipin synthase
VTALATPKLAGSCRSGSRRRRAQRPNALTLIRILTIPGFLILLTSGRPGVALAVFVAGGITDALDGAIARLTDTKTELGAILDPLADKLLLLSSFCVLAFMELVPNWLTVLVIFRDVFLLAGYLPLRLHGEWIEVRPSVIGKMTTFFQLGAVTLVLVSVRLPTACREPAHRLLRRRGTTTGLSGLQYMLRGSPG